MVLKRVGIGLMFLVPVPGVVVRHFQAPECLRCAGHRGVTMETEAGRPVVATTDGVVEFAGSVGGRLYVVQRVSPTVRVTYGALASTSAHEAQAVSAGESLGISGESTYLSVRVGEVHVEPLRALGLGRSRLVPAP